MKLPAIAIVFAASAATAAPSPGLVDASSPEDLVALALAEPATAGETLAAGFGLGLGDPVSVVFAGIGPATPAADAEALAAAIVAADPPAADLVAASSLSALGPVAATRATGMVIAIIEALEAALPPGDELEAEIIEVLAAVAGLLDPAALPALAAAIAEATAADDDGATLLAALGPGVETGAIATPFGDGAGATPVVTPDSADQDAPSGN